MGSIGQSIFGGSKSSGSSGNKNMGMLNDKFSGVADYANTGASGLAALLGGDSSGFNAYKQATGFDDTLARGLSGITGTRAAMGMLRGGGTGKALGNYIADTQNQYANQYGSQLQGLSQIGLGAGGILSDAGKFSKQKSSSKPGLGGLIGGALTGGATGGL